MALPSTEKLLPKLDTAPDRAFNSLLGPWNLRMPNLHNDLVQRLKELAQSDSAGAHPYVISETLGAGGSAAVFVAETEHRKIALKIYDPSFFGDENGAAEMHRLELQRGLIGKHSDFLADVYVVEQRQGTCFIEMEYCPWRTLKDALTSVPTTATPVLLGQLVQAVRFLDGFGLVHRDIKPENILINESFTQLKLIDFGVLRDVSANDLPSATDHGKRRPFIATAQYSSPEYLFRLIEPSPKLWKALTLYQIGGVLHDLLAKKPIFHDEVETGNRYKLAWAVLNKRPSLDAFRKADNHALITLASSCLTKDIELRLQLVDWDDFDSSAKDEVSILARRLSKAKASSKYNPARVDNDLDVKRKLHQEKLYNQVLGKIVDRFESSIKVETINREPEGSFLLKFEFPGDLPVVFVLVIITWNSGENAGTALVGVKVALNETADSTCMSTVGETSVSDSNDESLCDALLNKASALVSECLDFAEMQNAEAAQNPDAENTSNDREETSE